MEAVGAVTRVHLDETDAFDRQRGGLRQLNVTSKWVFEHQQVTVVANHKAWLLKSYLSAARKMQAHD